ncbi:MAG TPA: hypothetical protein VGE74_14935 [Gemmata sp.]
MENWVRGGSEPLAERGVVPAGIAGALGGGVVAVALGAGWGVTYPQACGTIGAMLGSAAASFAWWVTVRTAGAATTALAARRSVPRTTRAAVPHA